METTPHDPDRDLDDRDYEREEDIGTPPEDLEWRDNDIDPLTEDEDEEVVKSFHEDPHGRNSLLDEGEDEDEADLGQNDDIHDERIQR